MSCTDSCRTKYEGFEQGTIAEQRLVQRAKVVRRIAEFVLLPRGYGANSSKSGRHDSRNALTMSGNFRWPSSRAIAVLTRESKIG